MKKSFLAALALAAVLCGTAMAKDEIVISTGVNMVAGKFDPILGHGVWGPDIFHCHLLKSGKDNVLEKDLAVREKISGDGLSYTYEIRRDVKFADGTPLTAQDIVFTYEKTKASVSAADLTVMESVKALDDFTVEFTLSEPSSLFPYALSFVGIVPAHAYHEAYGDRPVCSGAWRVVDFQKDQQLILEPNPYYYGTKSPFRRVTILKIDEDAALAAAQSGQLDLVLVNAEYAHSAVEGMKLLSLDVLGTLAVNLPVIPEGTAPDGSKTGNNVTCDPAIRKALDIGINRRQLVERALNGMGTPACSIGSDTLPWAAHIDFEDNRVEEAKKLLEDAGWKDTDGDGIREKNGVKAEFTVTGRSNDLDRYNTVVALADNAKALGIRIIARSAPWAECRKARAVPTCWSVGAPSPMDFRLYYHSSNINKAVINNPSSYSNPDVDALIDQAMRATDQNTASTFWSKAEARAAADVPFLYISRPRNNYLVRKGLRLPPLNKIPVRNQGLSVVENMNEWSWDD